MNRIKHWIIFSTVLAILLASESANADEGKPPTFETEYNFRKVYFFKPKFKAMAVGLGGSFGTSWGYGNAKEAAADAINYCRKSFASLKRKDGTDSRCHLAAVGNKPLKNEVVTYASWQVPATGEDMPLSAGFKSLLPNKKARGILLGVHGCSGLESIGYNSAWGSFYNSLGLDFYVPLSFADQRPHSVCGSQQGNGLHLVSEVIRLRISQTLRTIEKLRKDNPGLPIYLWGHSEGGLIVQATEVKVQGIVVSGEECGVLGMPVAPAPNVPFLYVLGENDKFVDGMKYPFTEKSLQVCQKFMGKRKWNAAVIQKNGHAIWPWREKTAKAIAKFVGGTWHEVVPAQMSDKPSTTDGSNREFEIYKDRGGHKAFAIGSNGKYAWTEGWEFAEDAAQFALFDCAKRQTIDVFATGRHHCVLVDVDGKDQQ